MAELADGRARASSTTSWSSAATSGRRSPTPATRSAARSGCSCCSTHPTGSSAAALLCTGARIGDAGTVGRPDRAGDARPGTPVLVSGVGRALVRARASSSASPTAGLGAAARAARRRRRGLRPGLRRAGATSTSATGSPRSAQPVLAVAGSDDAVTPPERLREIADGVQDGRFVVLEDVAHLAPAEAPERGGRPDPASTSSASRLPRADGVLRRRDGRAPRGARRRARRPGDRRAPPTAPGTSRSSSRRTPGARSGPGPAWTGAAAR